MSAAVAGRFDLEAQLGALGGEIAAIMRPLVEPLLEKLDWVTGDAEQVNDVARRWRLMSSALDRVADQERACLTDVDGEWEGRAQLAFEEAVDDVVRDVRGLVTRTEEVADQLDLAAEAVHRVEGIVRDLIRELIEWAALTLVVSAAGAIITLGASAAAGAAAAAARAGIVGARIATQLGQLALELRRIQLVIGVYQAWLGNLGMVKGQLVKTVQGQVVKAILPIDGDVLDPIKGLVDITLDPETCFEQDLPGPAW